jgi:ferredoxin
MKLKIDLDKCMRAGECYYNHPELFRMQDNGDPEVLVADITTAELRRHAEQAIEVCPAVAISLEEDG